MVQGCAGWEPIPAGSASARSSSAACPSARARGYGPGRLAGHAERPVGGLQREQLAQRPRARMPSPRPAPAARPRARAMPARPPAARSRWRGRAARPSSWPAAPPAPPPRSVSASAASSGGSSTPASSQASITAASQSTPSCQKWPSSSVSSAHTASPPPSSRRARRGRELARVRARLLGRARRVVGRAVDRPRRVAVLGVAARVAVRRPPTGSRSCARRGPSARGRSAPAAGRRRCAAAAAARRAVAEHVGEVDARRVHAGLLEQRVEPRRVPALRQPEAAVPVPEARAVRGDPDPELQPHARRRWRAAAAPRGWPTTSSDACGAKARHQVAAARLEALGGRRVELRGALELARDARDPPPPRCRAGASRPGSRAGTRGSARARPSPRAGRTAPG